MICQLSPSWNNWSAAYHCTDISRYFTQPHPIIDYWRFFSTVTCTTKNFFFYLTSFLHVLNIFPVLCFLGPSTTASHGNATTEQLIGTDVSPKLCDALHVWWKCTRHQTTLFQQNGTNISLSCFSSFNLIKQTFSFSCRRAVWNVT